MKFLMLVAAMSLSVSSFAYTDGEIFCKNGNPDLPNTSYKVSTSNLGGVDLPVLVITKYYLSSETGQVDTAVIKGVPAYSTSGGKEYMSLNQFRLQFEDDKLVNCTDPD
ncbi:hypothetical protein GW916_05905 [bacterium]|nr:hypothetical protein [bacterium]